MPSTHSVAHPPETVEGWYALHQLFRIDSDRRSQLAGAHDPMFDRATRHVAGDGWSGAVRLIGSSSDVMFVHFRPTLDDIGVAQRTLAGAAWMSGLIPTYTFLSVTEAGLYHLTATLAREAETRGGTVGDDTYQEALRARVAEECATSHVQRRLYPPRPDGMPYVCFYPMSKRRDAGQNWYTLGLDERSRLMRDHGTTGRRYAGRVLQVITGAIGLDAWEWGVTLFTADPLEFKRLVTDMRFDEVSAKYAEFGAFFVGRMGALQEILAP